MREAIAETEMQLSRDVVVGIDRDFAENEDEGQDINWLPIEEGKQNLHRIAHLAYLTNRADERPPVQKRGDKYSQNLHIVKRVVRDRSLQQQWSMPEQE